MSRVPDELRARLGRVVVQGASGSGKSTLAAALAQRLGAPHLELDGLYQQPEWTPLDVEEFRATVTSFVTQPRWVVDGNYSQVRDILWPRSTLIVMIDLPRRIVIARVIKRTFVRIVRREELWNGNRESWRNALSRDPMRSIIVWSWTSHHRYHDEVPRAAKEAVGEHRVVTLRSARDVKDFLTQATPR